MVRSTVQRRLQRRRARRSGLRLHEGQAESSRRRDRPRQGRVPIDVKVAEPVLKRAQKAGEYRPMLFRSPQALLLVKRLLAQRVFVRLP